MVSRPTSIPSPFYKVLEGRVHLPPIFVFWLLNVESKLGRHSTYFVAWTNLPSNFFYECKDKKPHYMFSKLNNSSFRTTAWTLAFNMTWSLWERNQVGRWHRHTFCRWWWTVIRESFLTGCQIHINRKILSKRMLKS